MLNHVSQGMMIASGSTDLEAVNHNDVGVRELTPILPARTPTLGVIDLSDVPSGLTRYVETLWPALIERFRVVVFGDPGGPYGTFPHATFVPLPPNLWSRSLKPTAEADASVPSPPSATRGPLTTARTVWRRYFPESARFSAGFVRDAVILARVLRRTPTDVAYLPVCDLEFAALAARLSGVPTVGVLHMPTPKSLAGPRRELGRLTLSCLHRVVAVSDDAAASWLRAYPSLRDKLEVIKNGVVLPELPDKPTARAAVLQRYGIGQRVGPLLMAAGRLAPQKGFGYLIEAVAAVRKSHPDATVLIAGQGPAESELRELARALDVESNVRFLGQVPALGHIYSAADGFILSSVAEAMPFVLLEAMAHALPIVATSVGGVPEVIRDGENGLLVPPRDPVRLAAAIATLLRSPDQAARFGAAGRETVSDRFSVAEMRRRTTDVLSSAVGIHRAGRGPARRAPTRVPSYPRVGS